MMQRQKLKVFEESIFLGDIVKEEISDPHGERIDIANVTSTSGCTFVCVRLCRLSIDLRI